MPALQAPRDCQMLVPNLLSRSSEVGDLQRVSGAEIDVRDLPGHDENLLTLLGTIEARVKAAQAILTRIEELQMDGKVEIVECDEARRDPPPLRARESEPVRQP